MDSNSKANGNPEAAAVATQGEQADTILLTYDRATDYLNIGGHCNSLDLMLDILGRATRVLEMRWRQEEQKKFVAQMREQEKNQALAASIFGNGRAKG